ncbi:hypothetical protein [Reichenbachiella sp. MALMAid0571]|uniref:hypothetical protein n=1 Tax=Reichenbachiella sp. MALMAid0571 TaxID=3143939 RepID=UPI0032E00F05
MSILVSIPNQLEEQKEAQHKKSYLYEKLSTSIFWTKLTNWEFWPFALFYFPVMFYWTWLVIKTRSFFFFTASNPGIEFGGMLGESKEKIYNSINSKFIPKTYKVTPDMDQKTFREKLQKENISFPFILKPDVGERGWMVELIKNKTDLDRYLNKIQVDFLVQEYVHFPVELGIFYYRFPNRENGTVSSIVMKEMLNVTGDGNSTVRELVLQDVRAKMHLHTLEASNLDILEYIPLYNEEVELVSIGNHCRGTTFLNGNHLINSKLISVIDKISKGIDGFYFGRFDLRCASIEDLYEGKNFKIVELNGAGSEPAHIYHPGFPLSQAYTDIIHHLKVLAEISMLNHKKGHPYMSFSNGMKEVFKIRAYNKQKDQSA